MSRIGIKPIIVPQEVNIDLEPTEIKITGPLGYLNIDLPHGISVNQKEDKVSVVRGNNTKIQRSLHGTVRSLLQGAVIGVSQGFEKKLEMIGIGYRAVLEDNELVLSVGFTHPVRLKLPDKITVKIEKNIILIFGINKQLVGQFAAVVRSVKKPDPYKGKGIRYQGEIVRMKQGKAVKG